MRSTTARVVVIMMADESDDCRDVVRYWRLLNEGWERVFGSRLIAGGGTIEYSRMKLLLNWMVNFGIRVLFRVPLNDTTNAFKAYRRTAVDGCRPLIAPHFISPSNCRSRRLSEATRGP
jgi:dolichol-phosphate mannosyltransferase